MDAAEHPAEPTQSTPSLWLAWLPAVLYMLLIWWISSNQVTLPLDQIPWQDKGVHALEYAVLGACFAHAVWITWPGRGLAGALSAWLFATSFGLLDELHQAFVPGRNADVLDLVADALGAFVAVSVIWTARGILAARRR